jgi:hypothetical protein
MRGNVKKKYFPSELKPVENSSWHSAPLARELPVCVDPLRGAGVIADQREA